MVRPITMLGIAGSLRRGSYNSASLRAAQALLPENARLEIFDLRGIPPYNQDEEQHPPTEVISLKDHIRSADAIIFATPEYNYSVSGVLKNALDWASRPHGDNAWDGKPAAILSASVGRMGGLRAQYHLRQSLVYLNMYPLNKPEVMITDARKKFDDHGNLIDEETKRRIHELLQALVAWTEELHRVHID